MPWDPGHGAVSSCASFCSSHTREERGFYSNRGNQKEPTVLRKEGKTRASEELAMDKKWLHLLTSGPHHHCTAQVLGVSGTPCLWRSGELAQEAWGKLGGGTAPSQLWPGFPGSCYEPTISTPHIWQPVPTRSRFLLALKMGRKVSTGFLCVYLWASQPPL